MKVKVIIGGVDYTKYVEIPFQTMKKTDESLNMASIRLFYTNKKKEFEPFTLVEIYLKNDIEEKHRFYVASDVTETILSTGKVNHTLVLIEETKEFERLLLTKTSTNPLSKDYTDIATLAVPNAKGFSLSTINVPEHFITPQRIGSFYVPSIQSITNREFVTRGGFYAGYEIIAPNGKTVYSNYFSKRGFTLNPDMAGEYIIKYTAKQPSYDVSMSTGGGGYALNSEIIFKINFVEFSLDAKTKTITSVVNSLLNTCETIRKGQKPRFIFNSEQAELYKDTFCPEISFTKQTLWEALRQVGGIIHCIPRLKDNEIYFDSYESIVYSNISKTKPVSETGKFDIEQFCSTIESAVDNLIADNNNLQGTIDDYGGIYKTARTEQQEAQITEDNIFIETLLPIGKVFKVEIGGLPNNEDFNIDITNYIFERSEYNALSSYDETYPTSKALALYYTLGEKNIRGLNFKVEDAVNSIFRNTAIENIISHKLNKDHNWWTNLWDDTDETKLQFRVTYQPYYSATLRQVKPNLKDLKFKSILSYTQGVNSISTQAYGEHLKGVVSRIGTPEKRYTYILNQLSKVPNAGDKFDRDYIISEVNCEYYQDYILCEIALSKNFNRWNEFVGVDNELRTYEVSNKQVSDRPVIWEDFAVIQKKRKLDLVVDIESENIGNAYSVDKGVWSGAKYALLCDDGSTLFIGDKGNWQKLNTTTDYANLCFGLSGANNPIILATPHNEKSYCHVYYINDDNNYSVAEIDLGKTVKINDILFGGNRFVAVFDDEIESQEIVVGNVVDGSEYQIEWRSIVSLPYRADWKIARIQNENYGGFVFFDGENCYILKDAKNRIENAEGTYLKDMIGMTTINGVCYAFNNENIAEAVIDSELNITSWSISYFPDDDIRYFNGDNESFVAISKNNIYYSKNLLVWEKADKTVQNGVRIIQGDKTLILNGTNLIYYVSLNTRDDFLTPEGISRLAETWMEGIIQEPIKIANSKTYDDQDILMYEYWLPVITSAIGNTLQIQFSYIDNFSAGTYVEYKNATKTQNYAPYGNPFGEAKYLSVDFYADAPIDAPNDFSQIVEIGDNLPKIENSKNQEPLLSSSVKNVWANTNHIILEKDSREKISFSYCMHFVANDDDIIIGSGLAQVNSFAINKLGDNNQIEPAKLYILNRELKNLERNVDLEGAIEQESNIKYSDHSIFKKIHFDINENDKMLSDGKSWAIAIKNPANPNEHLLLFGKNVEFKEGDSAEEVWGNYEIAFTHDIHEFL